MSSLYPATIDSETQLDQVLTDPSPELVATIRNLSSPLVMIGASGKMGPSLALMAKRAAEAAGHPLEIVAASRFSNQDTAAWFEAHGIRTQQVDMLTRSSVQRLPKSENVLYLVGMKFGTSADPSPTWVTNTLSPMLAAEHFAGARVVALSTGNVYPMTRLDYGGSRESDSLTPIGEYPNAAVARERLFEYFSRQFHSPLTNVRLNYAHDLRYGVLSDIAYKVYHDLPVDVSMGYFNAIWQGDANNYILRCFDLCTVPATAINLTSRKVYSHRKVAELFGLYFGKVPQILGLEQDTALLSNTDFLLEKLGPERLEGDLLIKWIANWMKIGGRLLGKPTHFEIRDGKF
ncbi:MAG: NAD-dependent epimerase/dehydratase family protein [Planctomycetales bacterium]|nr:NAD-dependent epimerase/dehydratase family protein [Planctomycetales bacterium]